MNNKKKNNTVSLVITDQTLYQFSYEVKKVDFNTYLQIQMSL